MFIEYNEHDDDAHKRIGFMTHILNIRNLTGLDTLAGKSGGLRDFPKFLTAIEETSDEDIVVLDWTGIEIATASYFGATFISLLRMAVAGELNRYFVLVGLNRTCLDELKLVLELQGLVAATGKMEKGVVRHLELLGNLDNAYTEALAAVQQVDSASATDLHKKNQSRAKIGKTAWINRLTNLHRMRLIRKQRVGREYIFRALTSER
jgi:hypothetical protein